MVPGATDSTVNAFVATAAGNMEDLWLEDEKKRTLALAIRSTPTEHGVIRRQPQTLEDVVTALEATGFDLLFELRRKLRAWRDGSAHFEAHLSRLALILWIPKKRRAGDALPEAIDTCALLAGDKTALEVGEDVGAWETQEIDGIPQPAAIVGIGDGPANANRGARCPVALLPVSFHFDRSIAAAMSGSEVCECRVAIVGVGALGGQVANNLARSGFGCLTLIDDDSLLPHNLSRHVLGGSYVGHPKSRALAEELAILFGSEPAPQALVLNVLSRSIAGRRQIEEALRSADLILDLSASVAAARFLAHCESEARRVSVHLNPSGTDLVVMVEDSSRRLTLHDLELQFYRNLTENESLEGHYSPTGVRLRYGQGCRDVSVVLSNDRVALHGAIASSAVRSLDSDAAITVWKVDPDSTVRRVDVKPSPVHRLVLGDWTVTFDELFVEKLRRSRADKLPNETGGVVIGAHDLERLSVHLAVRLPSPSDSTEWPTLYIRGANNLSRIVKRHERRTDGMLSYVGEWHSHPCGRDSSPSRLDRQALANVTEEMRMDGLPALTLIVGESDLTVLLQSASQPNEARWKFSESSQALPAP
jgi:integrative and conjugative element protein (TIGR02256 family)